MAKARFKVCAATDADAAEVRALVFPIMEEFGLGLAPAGADADLYKIEASYQARGGWLDLVRSDDQLVGTVGMYPLDDHTIELRKMYLRADQRGSGLGKALLARSIRRAAAAGYGEIVLETAAVLKAAIGLYRSFGFERDDGNRPGCGKQSCDQVWRLRLDQFQLPQIETPHLEECA